ncbi:MAG: hypothetical protein QM831_11070 [Kofleriaceae bacterium]
MAFLFAYWSGNIAYRKGHDKLVWQVVGFFFGVIGLIIAACLGNRYQQQPNYYNHQRPY